MSRLVKDGKIYLDGTLREYEKEKLVFEKEEIVEDWEEETGLDIKILIKALQQEFVYVVNFDTEEIIEHHFMVEQRFGKYLIYDREWLYELKDYGITWALTKNEIDLERRKRV